MAQASENTLKSYKSKIDFGTEENLPMSPALAINEIISKNKIPAIAYGYDGTLIGIETKISYMFWRIGTDIEFKGTLLKSKATNTKPKSELLFSIDNIEESKEELRNILKQKFPYVSVVHSTLGGDETVTIMVAIAKEPKEDWSNGYFENSTYARIHIDRKGTVEKFAGYKFKLRKFKGKSIKDIGNKINDRLIPSGK